MSDKPQPTPEQRAAVFRALAQRARAQAAMFDLAAECVLAQTSAEAFIAAFRASEAQEVAGHPDLAEQNLQLDGFYDGPED